MRTSMLLIIIAVITLILIWKSAMKARELAMAVAIKTCKTWDALLLDDMVCLVKIKLIRCYNTGRLCLFREYAFEYSYDGVARFKAFLQFNGGYFSHVISNNQAMQPQEIQSAIEAQADLKLDSKTANNVIDFNPKKPKKDY